LPPEIEKMEISERKARLKQEIKSLILDSARQVFADKGMEHTTIRNIAERIGYSVGTVYVYYRDKNDIMHDLHTQGFTRLRETMIVLNHVTDPMERLKAMGRVYIKFALDHTEMYDLMFNSKDPMHAIEHKQEEGDNQWREGKNTFSVLKETVKECIEHGYFSGQKLEPTSFAIWACVHGLCTLHIRERTKRVNFEHPETILDEAYTDFLVMMQRK
jgi:AcrR family transcriptional regulator